MRALIAMSGGVDSSVAAYLMKEQGYTCAGVTMKLFGNEDIGILGESSCCSLDDVEDARSVAYQLNMPYYVFNFSDRFRECVIDKFIRTYESGATPNPCIDCNRYLKFDKLFHRAKELAYDFVVTGHYARVAYDAASGRYILKKAQDASKDQSYVLYTMSQEQLSHTKFPLGELEKCQVRAIAQEQGFINAKKKESQDICFVPEGKYADFIRRYTGKQYPEGDFVDQSGRIIGRHNGIICYTVGQRRGLGVPSKQPLYVCKIDPVNNDIVLGGENELYTEKLIAGDINMISRPSLEAPRRLKAKVRYGQPEQWVTAVQTDTDRLEIRFDTPQRAVTKGQALVLYDGDVVVGGGTILETMAPRL